MKIIYTLFAIALLYVGSVVLLMNLSSVSNLKTVEINGEVHVVPSDIFHAQGFRDEMSVELARARDAVRSSELLHAKREASLAGVKRYADFHYSMMGNMIQQVIAVATLAAKAGEQLGAGFQENPKVKTFLTQTQERLTQQVFSPLIEMDDQEQVHLYRELEQSQASLMSLIYKRVHQESIIKVSAEYLPTDQHDFQMNKHGLKFGASAVMGAAFMFRAIRKRLAKSIESLSIKIMGKIITKVATKQGIKTGGRLAAVGTTAVSAGVACAWGGPLALLCGTGGAIVGFLTTEFVFNELDELITRDDFEEELTAQVDLIFNELVATLSSNLDQLEEAMLSQNQPQREKVYLKSYF